MRIHLDLVGCQVIIERVEIDAPDPRQLPCFLRFLCHCYNFCAQGTCNTHPIRVSYIAEYTM